MAAYGTDQEYLLLQQRFDRYKPWLVFLVICVENNHLDNSNNGRGNYYKPYFTTKEGVLTLQGVPVPRSERAFCAEHSILQHSFLIRLTARAYYRLTRPRPIMFKDPTTAILAEMRRYLRAKGALFVVGLTGHDLGLEQFLKESDIPCLDLSAAERIAGEWHWSPEGHSYVCDKLEAYLAATKAPVDP